MNRYKGFPFYAFCMLNHGPTIVLRQLLLSPPSCKKKKWLFLKKISTWAAACVCEKTQTKLSSSLIHHRPTGVYRNFVMSSFDKLCLYIDSAALGEIRDYIPGPWWRGRGNDAQRLRCDLISILKQSFAMQQIGGTKLRFCGSSKVISCSCRSFLVNEMLFWNKDQTVTLVFLLSILADA